MECLDVGDEVPGSGGFEGRVGRALPAAALIEVHDSVFSGWKNRRCLGSEPPPGPPCTKTTGLPDGLPLSSK